MATTTTETDYIEDLPFPVPFSFLSSLSQNVMMLYTNAKFYRTVFNNNATMTVAMGNNYSPGLWYSLDAYLPINIFNSTKPLPEFSFPNLNSVQLNENLKVYHDVEINFKIVKNLNEDGFQNTRKIQCLPVKGDSVTPYDNSLIGYCQPGPNNKNNMFIKGEIDHAAGDVVKLKINIVQDNEFGDQSDTILIINYITWNMMTLKVL